MKSISICAVIVTHHRSQLLEKMIQSLEAARGSIHLSFRVCINGSDPISEKITLALKERNPDRVSTLILSEAVSPAQARNFLLKDLNCDWVYFIDDDAYVPSTHFDHFLEVLEEFPTALAIGGPNLTPPKSSEFQHAVGLALSSRFATWFSSSRYKAQGAIRPCSESSLILCNLFVRASYLKADSFIPDLVCAEENALIESLSGRSGEILHAPNLIVFHERRPTLKTLGRQCFNYGYGRGQLLRQEISQLKLAHLLPSFCVLYLAIGIIEWFFVGRFDPLLKNLLIIYILLCLIVGFSLNRPSIRLSQLLMTSLIFPVIHSCYGVGIMRGLFWRR